MTLKSYVVVANDKTYGTPQGTITAAHTPIQAVVKVKRFEKNFQGLGKVLYVLEDIVGDDTGLELNRAGNHNKYHIADDEYGNLIKFGLHIPGISQIIERLGLPYRAIPVESEGYQSYSVHTHTTKLAELMKRGKA